MANTTLVTSYPNKTAIFSMGPLRARIVIFTAPAGETYATGGYPYLSGSAIVKAMGISAILALVPAGHNTAALGILPDWNYQTSKLQLIETGAATASSTSAITGTAAAQTFSGSALATHTHVAGQADNSAAPGDITAFVGLLDGAGVAVTGVTIGAAGNGADLPWNTSAITAGTPAGTNNTSAVTGTAAAQSVAAAALAEVANATSIAAMAWQFLVIGQ